MNQSSEIKKANKFPRILSFCKPGSRKNKISVNPGANINRYRDFMNTLPLSAFEADIKGNITYANPKAYELFGHHTSTRHDGNSFLDFISNNDRDRARENFIKTVNNKHVAGNHYTAIKKNGDLLPIIIYSSPFFSNDKVTGIRGVILDATLQKEVLKFWKATELKYRSLIKHSSDAIYLLYNKKIVLNNEKFEKLFGYTNDEVNSSDFEFMKIVNSESQRDFNRMIQDVRKGVNENVLMQFKGIKKSGDPVDCEVSLARIPYNNSYAVQGIIRDIGERKRVETNYKITSAILQTATEQSPAGILISDAPGINLLVANETALEILEVKNKINYQEEIKKSRLQIFDAKNNPVGKFEHFTSAIERGEYTKNESLRIVFEDGKEKWLLTNSAPVFDDDKNIIAAMIVFLDITQERTAINRLEVNEERLKSIYENASVGMFRISNLMRFEMMNPAFVKMLGYEKESELLKNEWIVNGFFAGIQHGKKTMKNNSENEFEISLPRRNGEVAALRVTIKCHHNETGGLLYCDGMVEDASKKKETEQVLVEAMKKAEAAEKLKSEFLAQMSHEIRTPINTILSFTGLLKEEMFDKIPEDLRISFDLINRAGKRIIRTIDLILLMSELQTRTYESDPKVFDIYTDVIENIYPQYLSLAREKGLVFNINNNCRNTKIKADFIGVQQMISNLFDNAIKYTERGSVMVEILPSHNSHVTVAVKDTGIGIAEEYLQTMFKPFSQEESGYTRKYEGNGLGLAVVNKFAELNDASIEVESQKGEGTLIKINFGLS
jgi:PAS domain S-box-containing protein